MRSVSGRLTHGLAGVLLATAIFPATVFADEAAPRYTYLGAGYEWGRSKCAIEPVDTKLDGYTVEGSLGVFNFLHLIGAYYDGETTGEAAGLGDKGDGTCYELGAGLSYNFAPGADVVLRGYWVSVDLDVGGFSVDDDGFEPELLVRYAVSDRAEVQVGMAYYDVGDVDNTEIRAFLVYNVLPWLAIRAGGTVFDDDSSIVAGVRAYFGGNLF